MAGEVYSPIRLWEFGRPVIAKILTIQNFSPRWSKRSIMANVRPDYGTANIEEQYGDQRFVPSRPAWSEGSLETLYRR
jgi:hypothetical protein